MDDYVLSDLQHGKAECRIVKVDRDAFPDEPGRHVLHDLNVTTQLRGDFASAYTDGDNAHVHATDTQKNTVFALARLHGVASARGVPAAPRRALRRTQPWVTGARCPRRAVRLGPGARARARLRPHRGGDPHRGGADLGRARPSCSAACATSCCSSRTGCEFHGFPRDTYTTLPETDDRILATSVCRDLALRRRRSPTPTTTPSYAAVRAALLDAFAGTHSLALQQSSTRWASAALDAAPRSPRSG